MRRAIKDLVAPGRFLLIAGEEGEAWCEAAREIARAESIALDALRIGHIDGDLFDPRCTWLRWREIDARGAVLVRPDRFVAWPAGRTARTRRASSRALSRRSWLARECPADTRGGVKQYQPGGGTCPTQP